MLCVLVCLQTHTVCFQIFSGKQMLGNFVSNNGHLVCEYIHTNAAIDHFHKLVFKSTQLQYEML